MCKILVGRVLYFKWSVFSVKGILTPIRQFARLANATIACKTLAGEEIITSKYVQLTVTSTLQANFRFEKPERGVELKSQPNIGPFSFISEKHGAYFL